MSSPKTTTPPRLLFLQHDSIFENYGGVQYYLDDLLTLASQAYGAENIRAIVPQRTPHFSFQSRPYHLEIVRLAQRGLLKKFSNRYSLKYLNIAKRECSAFHPQLIIATHISLGPLAYALSKSTGIPYVVIAYGYEAWGKWLPQDKWALKRARGILSISHWTKTILQNHGFQANRIQVIHPCLTQEFAELSYLKPSENLTGHLRLLTVGRLSSEEQYKGHDHVIEALKLMRERYPRVHVEYDIQGEGSDLPRLQNLVRKYELEDSVHFLAAVKDRSALEEIFRHHDALVMPSRFAKWGGRWRGEGFGIVYVEAAACGLPSIAYACGGAMDIIQSEKTGVLVTPDHIGELMKAILDYAENPHKRIEMGKQAHTHAQMHFSPTAILSELKSAFGNFLLPHPRKNISQTPKDSAEATPTPR